MCENLRGLLGSCKDEDDRVQQGCICSSGAMVEGARGQRKREGGRGGEGCVWVCVSERYPKRPWNRHPGEHLFLE